MASPSAFRNVDDTAVTGNLATREEASNAAGLARTTGWLSCTTVRARRNGMSRNGRTLATLAVVALTSWSCGGSTAPDAAPKVAAIVVSPVSSTLALNAQLPL